VTFKVGDQVTKRDGYKWPGEVRAVFTTKGGKTRVVVECTVREVTGALHIFAPEQLKGEEEE
jgi:hypothetical protein